MVQHFTKTFLVLLGSCALSACDGVVLQGVEGALSGSSKSNAASAPCNVPTGANVVRVEGPRSAGSFTLHTVSEVVGDSRAGSPDYLYLQQGEAVAVAGPEATLDAADWQPQEASISFVEPYPSAAAGVAVRFNAHVGMTIPADDFEYEVDLARVDAWQQGGVLKTCLVWRARDDAGGVAHNIHPSLEVDGQSVGSVAPFTIEARP